MTYAKSRICLRKMKLIIFGDFERQKDHRILARRLEQMIINKKEKKTCHLVDFGTEWKWKKAKKMDWIIKKQKKKKQKSCGT